MDLFGSVSHLYQYLNKESDRICLEIELRPSERESARIELVKRILKSENPIIDTELPKSQIIYLIKRLRKAGLSIKSIVRITGISKHIVENS